MSTCTSSIEGSGSPSIVGFKKVNSASLAATDIAAVTKVTAPLVRATSYIKVGSAYIFSGAAAYEATILAEATALVATPLIGSIYLSRAGRVWSFNSDTNATRLQWIT